MTTGTLIEYARRCGISAPRVTKLRKEGRLVLIEQGKGRVLVDFEGSDALIRATENAAQPTKKAGRPPGGAEGGSPRPPGRPPVPELGRATLQLRQSQAIHKDYAAKMAAIEYGKAAGLLVERAGVESAVADAFRELRDAIMTVPSRAAPTVTGITDMRAVQTAIEDELRTALAAFDKRIAAKLAARIAK
jgi:hypothetical protein